MESRPTHSSLRIPSLLALAILGCLAGCSKTAPLAPAPAPVLSRFDAPSPAEVLRAGSQSPAAPSPASVAHAARTDAALTTDPTPSDWREVGGGPVMAGASASLCAGRYRLQIDAGAVDVDTKFTISTYDSTVLDVELEPHGRTFQQPVKLVVSYCGTSADPASPDYDGRLPEVVWYDDASGAWTVVPAVVNANQRTITVSLTHFSRYAVRRAKASW